MVTAEGGPTAGRWRRRARALLATVDAHPAATVFGLALGLRLLAVVWLSHVPYDQGGDAPHYLSIARDLVAGRGYGETSGDTIRVPLYQVFLAWHLWAFGEALWTIAVSQAVVGAATAVLMTHTAEALLPGPRRWIVGLLWAAYPPAILNTVVVFTQTLQVFFLAAAFLLVIRGVRLRSTWRCLAAAALWAAACMTRSGNLFFLPVFAAAPLLCWRLAAGATRRWAVATALSMLAVGVAGTVWWTAREFPTTYRLEYLFLDRHERRAATLLLRPFEPVHGPAARWLQRSLGGVPSAAAGAASTVDTVPAARRDSTPTAPVAVETVVGTWQYEVGRMPVKLWQAFGAPDGTVQMGCTGPPGGFWATFRAEILVHPLRVVGVALGQSCLALKVGMYLEHYALLALALGGLVVLARQLPGVALLLVAYGGYTVTIIVLGSNYGNDLAAVPRFAFSLMPVAVLLAGVLLVPDRGPREDRPPRPQGHA